MNSVSLTEEHEAPQAGKIGLWLFILSEALLFGGFFSSYFMLRWSNDACRLGAPAWPSQDYGMALALAAFNTFILITSSYTMVRSYAGIRAGKEKTFAVNLAATVALGAAFLAVKAVEYGLKIHHGQYPGGTYASANPGLGIFFSFYFAMTGLHALHVIAGLVWNSLLLLSKQDRRSEGFSRKVEYAGLYWHFVDIVWVFLFPLFYLV